VKISVEATSTEIFTEDLSRDQEHDARLGHLLTLLGRLVDFDRVRSIAVIGCGPRPETVRILDALGYEVTGIEPVPGYVEKAGEFLGGRGTICLGSAEELPLQDGSQNVVLLESVLEHVDSPGKALSETYRVLEPGGIAVVVTTNRLRFSPSGECAEFNVRFYNWLPKLVKESFVFEQLHFRPELANYTPRPAVHWFSYGDLCDLGRLVGFAHFYSHVDLLRPDDGSIGSTRLKRRILTLVQEQPWLRALALTQVGGTVVMWKRGQTSSSDTL
jgi:ubiquinone/menaquinone biosynthesis C-methylase UbiE